jgi:hypothetical protein
MSALGERTQRILCRMKAIEQVFEMRAKVCRTVCMGLISHDTMRMDIIRLSTSGSSLLL